MSSEGELERSQLEALVPDFTAKISDHVADFVTKSRQQPKLVEILILMIINQVIPK